MDFAEFKVCSDTSKRYTENNAVAMKQEPLDQETMTYTG